MKRITAVWGIQKIRGEWKKPEDWTRELQKAWCRDERAEDIEELVIIIGNSDWQTQRPLHPPQDATIKAYPTGCAAWTGTTETTNTITSRDPNLRITETVTSSLRFVIDSSYIRPNKPRQYWKVVSGTLTWSAQVAGQCTGTGGGSLAVRDMGPGDEVARLTIYEESGKMVYMLTGGPWPSDIPKYRLNCPNGSGPPPEFPLMAALGWFNYDSNRNQLAADGKTFRGDFTSHVPASNGGITTHFRYSFQVSP
jgi:hypothetical protein